MISSVFPQGCTHDAGFDSRMVVGWTVQLRQEKTIATRLIEQVIADQELNGHSVEVVHTDNGKVMTSHMMKGMLVEHGVQLSLIRPNASNDNPFEESSHRTIKHHRYALETYGDIQHAQKVIGRIIEKCNNRVCYSKLGGNSPRQASQPYITERYTGPGEYHLCIKNKTSLFRKCGNLTVNWKYPLESGFK